MYMSGLSDEAGAGAGLAMAVKQLGSPSPEEVNLLEQYVSNTLYQGNSKERGHFLQARRPCDRVRCRLQPCGHTCSRAVPPATVWSHLQPCGATGFLRRLGAPLAPLLDG